MQRIVIVGASGLGKEVAWVIERMNSIAPTFEIVGFCDDAPEKQEGIFAGYPLLGTLANVPSDGLGFICAIGNNRNRQRVTAQAISVGLTPVTVIDPTAVIAPDVTIGAGSFVGIGSVVSVGAVVGNGVIVNHQVCVGHDAAVGDFAQLCPGVCVSGGCDIGEGALLGTLAGTIPLKRVGAWATVGAGVVAMRDVADGTSVVRVK